MGKLQFSIAMLVITSGIPDGKWWVYGKIIRKPEENGGFTMFYPLVNVIKVCELENHHFLWDNSLFLWPCSIAMLVITRGYHVGPRIFSVKQIGATSHQNCDW